MSRRFRSGSTGETPYRSPEELRAARGPWGRVRRMFAHSTRNWWWTAHPAAH
ncbi:hypothetical protein C6376_18480 [Streptomyces sp. P3]|nr:hypothetical protein C6376_18480 [Streptomyces sp. P3]